MHSTMRRVFLGLLVPMAGVLAGCPVVQSQDTPVKEFKTKVPGTSSQAYVYVPSTYTGDKPIPLMITLHGTYLWDGYTRQIMEWKALAEREGFIVAAPELKSTQGILPRLEDAWQEDLQRDEAIILSLREKLLNDYSIDRGKIALSGFSAGGYPMWYAGLRNPGLFDVLISRAGNADMRIFESLNLTKETRRIPAMIFFGKDDVGPILDDGWMAFRWLRRHGWSKHNCELDETKGGHLRRPETAYKLWMKYSGR
jgi:poly(3-hydroxybutyrate) depolymerase